MMRKTGYQTINPHKKPPHGHEASSKQQKPSCRRNSGGQRPMMSAKPYPPSTTQASGGNRSAVQQSQQQYPQPSLQPVPLQQQQQQQQHAFMVPVIYQQYPMSQLTADSSFGSQATSGGRVSFAGPPAHQSSQTSVTPSTSSSGHGRPRPVAMPNPSSQGKQRPPMALMEQLFGRSPRLSVGGRSALHGSCTSQPSEEQRVGLSQGTVSSAPRGFRHASSTGNRSIARDLRRPVEDNLSQGEGPIARGSSILAAGSLAFRQRCLDASSICGATQGSSRTANHSAKNPNRPVDNSDLMHILMKELTGVFEAKLEAERIKMQEERRKDRADFDAKIEDERLITKGIMEEALEKQRVKTQNTVSKNHIENKQMLLKLQGDMEDCKEEHTDYSNRMEGILNSKVAKITKSIDDQLVNKFHDLDSENEERFSSYCSKLSTQMKDLELNAEKALQEESTKVKKSIRESADDAKNVLAEEFASAKEGLAEELVNAKDDLKATGRSFLQIEAKRHAESFRSMIQSFKDDIKSLVKGPGTFAGRLFSSGNSKATANGQKGGTTTRTISPAPPSSRSKSKRTSTSTNSQASKRRRSNNMTKSKTIDKDSPLPLSLDMDPESENGSKIMNDVANAPARGLMPLKLTYNHRSSTSMDVPKNVATPRKAAQRTKAEGEGDCSQNTFSTMTATHCTPAKQARSTCQVEHAVFGEVNEEMCDENCPPSLSLVTPVAQAMDEEWVPSGNVKQVIKATTTEGPIKLQMTTRSRSTRYAKAKRLALQDAEAFLPNQDSNTSSLPIAEVLAAEAVECSSPLTTFSAVSAPKKRAPKHKSNATTKRNKKIKGSGVVRRRPHKKQATYAKRVLYHGAADDHFSFSFES